MTIIEMLTSSLKTAGMRLTPQRIFICQLLSETNAHPTAIEIFERLRVQYPSLSLMTVYNTLNTLVDLGAINALGHAGDDNVHYDGNITPHLNLACVSCHKIADIASPKMADLEGEINAASGFKIIGASMLYYGLCPDCQNLTVRETYQ